MLQLINANAQVNLIDSARQTLPAGFAQAQSATGESRSFDLQMAVQALAAIDTQAPLNEDASPATYILSEADAEQWLASALDQQQQAVRIEARETPEPQSQEPRQQEESEPLEQTAELPVEVLLQPQMQPREKPAADPARTASVPGQPAPLMPPPVAAAAMPQVAEIMMKTTSPAIAGDLVEANDHARLPGINTEADKATSSIAPSTVATATPLTAERHLKLHAPQAQWGEQMLASLREHVDMQINQRIQNATIRLDPPELGSMEIFLSHESGRLSVQLSAANADVARLLQQTSERLRQELVGQNFVQVNVQVSADAQGGRQQGHPRQAWLGEEPVLAAGLNTPTRERGNPDSTSDVLVTV